MNTKPLKLLARITLLVLAIASSSLELCASMNYTVNKVVIEVYRDGYAHIIMRLTVNETIPLIEVQILTLNPEFLTAYSEADILDYELNGRNLTIYTLGATNVIIEYDAGDLTSKVGEVWTVTIDTHYNVTLILPENSSVIYFNRVPEKIYSLNKKIALDLSSGVWEISYLLSPPPPITPSVTLTPTLTTSSTPTWKTTITPTSTTPITSSSTPATQTQPTTQEKIPEVTKTASLTSKTVTSTTNATTTKPQQFLFPLDINTMLIILVVVALAFSIILYSRWKRTAYLENLDLREKEVIDFITERGGKVMEAEIKDALKLPKTTAWRIIRKLEKRGIVRVRRVGRQNQVELLK